jgi:GNAT superfamily N-acetyltransferase
MSDYQVEVFRPEQLSADVWKEVHRLHHEVWVDALRGQRTIDEIYRFTKWSNNQHADFVASRLNPAAAIASGDFYEQQSYSDPVIALTRIDDVLVGYGYAADNVSGSPLAQALKRAAVIKNYLWIREVAVDPERQKQGIGTAIASKLVAGAVFLQPISTFIYPKETPDTQALLERKGFQVTAESVVAPFGAESKPTLQYMMRAKNKRAISR